MEITSIAIDAVDLGNDYHGDIIKLAEQNKKFILDLFNKLTSKAKKLFGERDKGWEIVEIQLNLSCDNPMLLPHVHYPEEGKKKMIIRTIDCFFSSKKGYRINDCKLIYQLSHEICHTLYPTGDNNVIFLEEGISVYFSFRCLHDYALESIRNKPEYLRIEKYIKDSGSQIDGIKYGKALEYVKKLGKNVDAIGSIVRELRVKTPIISNLLFSDLEKIGIEDNLAHNLVSQFPIS